MTLMQVQEIQANAWLPPKKKRKGKEDGRRANQGPGNKNKLPGYNLRKLSMTQMEMQEIQVNAWERLLPPKKIRKRKEDGRRANQEILRRESCKKRAIPAKKKRKGMGGWPKGIPRNAEKRLSSLQTKFTFLLSTIIEYQFCIKLWESSIQAPTEKGKDGSSK